MTRQYPVLDRFYPIVPDAAWMERLAPLGIKTVQLRAKDMELPRLRDEVDCCLALARRHSFQVIVNDYWEIAIDAGADFIHLGQEDLASADTAAIRRAGLRIGISTHDESELDAALAADPDYVALGPIYETKLKAMAWAPQGLTRIKVWRAKLGDIPLVAIGGITPELAPGVIAAGADCVAVITDFITHPSPEARVAHWVAWSAGDVRSSGR